MCKVHLPAEICPIDDVVVVLPSGRSGLWPSSYVRTSYDLYGENIPQAPFSLAFLARGSRSHSKGMWRAGTVLVWLHFWRIKL